MVLLNQNKMDTHILVEEFHKVYNNKKENLEDAMLQLRRMGATPIDTLKVLKEALGLSLREADDLVLHSVTWQDIKATTLELRETFYSVFTDTEIDLTKLDEENDPN